MIQDCKDHLRRNHALARHVSLTCALQVSRHSRLSESARRAAVLTSLPGTQRHVAELAADRLSPALLLQVYRRATGTLPSPYHLEACRSLEVVSAAQQSSSGLLRALRADAVAALCWCILLISGRHTSSAFVARRRSHQTGPHPSTRAAHLRQSTHHLSTGRSRAARPSPEPSWPFRRATVGRAS
jgi:hypothetical protein